MATLTLMQGSTPDTTADAATGMAPCLPGAAASAWLDVLLAMTTAGVRANDDGDRLPASEGPAVVKNTSGHRKGGGPAISS